MAVSGSAPAWLALGTAIAVSPRAAAGGRLAALGAAGRVNPSRRPDRRRAPGWVVPRRAAAGAAGLGVAVVAALAGPALALAASAAGLTAAVTLRDVIERRTAALRRRQLLAAVRVMVGELAAGARPATVLSAAAAVSGACYAPVLAAAAAAGADAAEVLMNDAGTRAVGLAWRLGAEVGAGLEGVLGRVADDLAAAGEHARAVEVALAGPRSSAAVLAGLPVLGIGLGVAMGARPLAFLTGSPDGRLVATAGILLDAGGVLWMRHIVRRVERS